MRHVVVLVVLVAAACGLSREEQAQELCADFPQCLETPDTCRIDCIDSLEQLQACCSCMEELDCIDVSAERCFTNVDGGGTVEVFGDCPTNSSLCGVDCEGVLDQREG